MTDLQVKLAEYSALRAEIGTHTSVQQGIFALTVTLAGTLAGFALDKGDPQLILMLPIATLLLGSGYIEETRRIFVLAAYIVQELATGEAAGLANWETSAFRSELTGYGSGVLYAFVFAIAPIAAQLTVICTEDDVKTPGWWLAGTGAALMLFLVTLAVSYRARPTRVR